MELAPSAADTERILELWDQMSEFDAARHDEALVFLLQALCGLVDAQNACWFAAVRLPDIAPGDPIHGWRTRFLQFLIPYKEIIASAKETEARLDQPDLDITVIRNVSFAGQLRANRLVDLAPPEWFEGDYYRTFCLDAGFADAIYAGCPVNGDVEVYFGLFRDPAHPGFTRADCDTVLAALRGLKWFHRQYLLSHGLLAASDPLSPAEREVLQGLLAGHSEKQIAAQQDRALSTVHEYVKTLYRKFGVKSRASLMALWLGRLA